MSGSECESISETHNWKGEPNFANASSSWTCDRASDAAEFFITDGSLTGEQWIKKYPHSPAIYSDSWVVLFSESRLGDREADRFLKYINNLS